MMRPERKLRGGSRNLLTVATALHLLQWAVVVVSAYLYQIVGGQDPDVMSNKLETGVNTIVAWSPAGESGTVQVLMLILIAVVVLVAIGFPMAVYLMQDDREWSDVAIAVVSSRYPFGGTYLLAKQSGRIESPIKAGALAALLYGLIWMPTLTGGMYAVA